MGLLKVVRGEGANPRRHVDKGRLVVSLLAFGALLVLSWQAGGICGEQIAIALEGERPIEVESFAE